jgi:hypothetical protein
MWRGFTRHSQEALLKGDPKVFTALSKPVYRMPGPGARIDTSFYDNRLVTVFAWPTAGAGLID